MSAEKTTPETERDAYIKSLYNARDEQAIAESEKTYGRYCRGIACSILTDDADAEECVNDTWLKTWNAIPPADPPSMKHWYGRLTRHLAIDRYRTIRRGKRGRDMTVLVSELDESVPDTPVEPDALPGLLTEFLSSLETEERNLFVGRYWHQYSVEILTETHGLTANAVYIRLTRTRQKLKAFLNQRGYRI